MSLLAHRAVAKEETVAVSATTMVVSAADQTAPAIKCRAGVRDTPAFFVLGTHQAGRHVGCERVELPGAILFPGDSAHHGVIGAQRWGRDEHIASSTRSGCFQGVSES